ncbi:hypothetical protein CPB84DRAFT_1843440 [Gymnopilus junonius]|uniref:Uncharacterized protein n=1 Tax=Gymnopilus junonius TaxID=109634 RepID=A0A9P5TSX9_GYMJU|nr:hypothetical protein CPB84DRAFT_1843440 [Gymnopilus junonius]
MAGQQVDVKTDICIIEDDLFILLVQEDKLIAEAIAAFHQNNGNHRLAGLPELTYKLMPGIVMIGTAVVFYLIPVTKTLEFIPPVPDSAHYGDHGKGMQPLENQHIILQCFKAFKMFVANDPAMKQVGVRIKGKDMARTFMGLFRSSITHIMIVHCSGVFIKVICILLTCLTYEHGN